MREATEIVVPVAVTLILIVMRETWFVIRDESSEKRRLK